VSGEWGVGGGEWMTASGRFGVLGPFGIPAMSRKGFHAEGAERCAEGSRGALRPAEDAERGGEIPPPDPKKALQSWMERSGAAVQGIRPREPFSACRSSAASACSARNCGAAMRA